MLSKHPLEVAGAGKLGPQGLAEALRLAIIAELDAVNLYLQLARAVEDEEARKVFEDIAREEKTHVGEFLALLKKIDPEQVKELEAGEAEVRELTGGDPPATPETKADPPAGLEELVKLRVLSVVRASRRLRGILEAVEAPGVEGVLVQADPTGRAVLSGLYEISESFSLPARILAYWSATGIEPPMPQLYRAARRLAAREDELIVEALKSAGEAHRLEMSDWSQPGAAVEDVARALAELESNAVPRPYVLLVSPARYAGLVRYSERSGVMDLHRVKALVHKVVIEPHVPDNAAILFSADPSVVDLLVGRDATVSVIGENAEGNVEFRVYEAILPRVKDPNGIAILS
ncbi:MAG: encapsulin [Desulfurococcales archaeon]|nr:encapsulin [Desulfurococcales archaeon]